MKRNFKIRAGVGVVSLVMIFTVLAEVTLAVLALGTASADYKLAAKSAESIKNFYKADAKAEAVLADIDEKLIFSEVEGLEEELSDLQNLEVLNRQESKVISYKVPLSDNQLLRVVLEIKGLASEQGIDYKIEAWQIENSRVWNYDESVTRFEEVILKKQVNQGWK